MSVLVLNTLSEYNDEVLELQNQICAQSEGSEVVYTMRLFLKKFCNMRRLFSLQRQNLDLYLIRRKIC